MGRRLSQGCNLLLHSAALWVVLLCIEVYSVMYGGYHCVHACDAVCVFAGAIREPSQMTAVLHTFTCGSREGQPSTHIAYDMHNLMWDDGLSAIRELFSRQPSTNTQNQIADNIPINSIELVSSIDNLAWHAMLMQCW